jgi:hypothetical protein
MAGNALTPSKKQTGLEVFSNFRVFKTLLLYSAELFIQIDLQTELR